MKHTLHTYSKQQILWLTHLDNVRNSSPIKFKINVFNVSVLCNGCLNFSGRMNVLGKSKKELLVSFSRHVVAIQTDNNTLAFRLWIFFCKESINRNFHIIVESLLQTPQTICAAIALLDYNENMRVTF